MPSVAPFSAAQLHEPILPLVKPPLRALYPARAIAAALATSRRATPGSSAHYYDVVGDDNTLVGVARTRTLQTAQPEQAVRDVMLDDVVAIPDWATVLIASEYF